MKRLRVAYFAGAALATLVTACSGDSSRLAPLNAALPAPDVSGKASWRSPSAKHVTLMYVSSISSTSTVSIYSYSTWELVGDIVGFFQPEGLCVDKAQDVYVTDFDRKRLIEYAHGAITPTRKVNDDAGFPVSCAVDPKSGDLAVSNSGGFSSSPGNVVVYRHAKGHPMEYTASGFFSYDFVDYDSRSNLFVDGEAYSIAGLLLAELPKGAAGFSLLTPNQQIVKPQGLAWDGQFLAVGDGQTNTIYQFLIVPPKAILVNSTKLGGAFDVNQFAFTGGSRHHPQATAVVGADFPAFKVEKWAYPAGGMPIESLSQSFSPVGVTISK